MQPFKVTFALASPVVVDSEYPIHLDALVAWALKEEAERDGSEDPWGDADDLSSALASHVYGPGERDYIWKASRLFFTPASERFLTNMVRRADPDAIYWDWADGNVDIPRVRPSTYSINTVSGQYRGYQMLVAQQWMKDVTAWGIGDIERVRELLSRIKHVGKLGRNGQGRVSAMTVEPAAADEVEHWMLRTLPHGMAGKPGVPYAEVNQCLRFPYWRKIAQERALEPVL